MLQIQACSTKLFIVTVLINSSPQYHVYLINVGNKDNAEHSKIAGQYNVKSFPTILLLNNGQREEEYNGERSKAAFMSYCKEKGLVV